MAPRPIFCIALIAAGMTVAPAVTNPAHAEALAVDLVIRGRILEASAQPLPQEAGEIELGSIWTYEVRVVRVIRGAADSPNIVVKGTSDAQIRDDKDFIFYLSREKEGAYRLEQLR
jgi:hypothetical protein